MSGPFSQHTDEPTASEDIASEDPCFDPCNSVTVVSTDLYNMKEQQMRLDVETATLETKVQRTLLEAVRTQSHSHCLDDLTELLYL
jgi:hypothetical protein